jgi:hypothetical protein
MNTTESKKRVFHFKVTYFKPSGKYYTHGTFDLECTNCGTEEHPTAYMITVVDHMKAMRDRRDAVMPGLTGCWHGHILVECDQGFPCLIPSVEADIE